MPRLPRLFAQAVRLLPWLPCGAACAGLAVLGALGALRFDLLLAALLGGVGVLAWAGRRMWVQALLFAALLGPLAWHFLVSLPAAEALTLAHPAAPAAEALPATPTPAPAMEALPFAHPAAPASTPAAAAPASTPAAAEPGAWVAEAEAWVAVEGTIRDRWTLPGTAGGKTARLLLGEVEVERGPDSWSLAEALVEFPAPSAWNFTAGRRIRLAGPLAGAERTGHRLRLALTDADWHFAGASYAPHSFETWRARLRARAVYYLAKPAQAVYLPLVLDLRERASPEGREVIGAFRRVGISHLFAISGLNIAMIFGLLMVVQRYVTWVLSPGQGWVHGRAAARIVIVGLIWAYIALIGYPVTAVRAAVMGSLLIWTELWGTRTPGLYVLVLTGMGMAALAPSVLYDISFQLSFLAYFFLVQAMDLGRALRSAGALSGALPGVLSGALPGVLSGVLSEALSGAGPPARPDLRAPGLRPAQAHAAPGLPRTPAAVAKIWSEATWGWVRWRVDVWRAALRKAALRKTAWTWLGHLGAFCAENLWVTGIVTLGLWPLMTARFHNLSLLVFAGNLLLVPAMELALLPVAMAALVTSSAFATAAPGAWPERVAFGALELGLGAWARVVHGLDRLGGTLVLRVDLDWPFAAFALYYLALLAALRGGVLIARKRGRRPSTGRPG